MKKTLLTLMVVLSILLLAACGSKKDTKASGELKVVRYNLQSNPPALDPALTTDSVSGNVLGHAMEGLTTLGPDGNPIPGVAESWSNDGNVWTFKLRKDAKWHNGDSVVAGDFVAAWERALNPETASEYSYIMYPIKGAQEYNEGKTKDFSTVGVKAEDDYTLVVEVKEPVTYMASLVSFYTFLPMNQNFYEEHLDGYATSSEAFLGNGPYKLTAWEFENKIILEKADNYWNKDSIKIDKIEMIMINDVSAGYKAYQNDELDFTIIPADDLLKLLDSPERVSWDDGSVWYLGFNTTKQFLSNKNIRKAFALAIDRQTFIDRIRNGAGAAAESFVSASIPGKNGFFREDYPQADYGLTYNPEKAKEYLALGMKELGITTAPKLSLLTSNSDVAMKDAQYYQEQIKVNLGVEMTLEPVTFQIRIQRTTAKDYDIVYAGWGPDYNDPMTFLDMWLKDSGQNNSGWFSSEYDSLILSAKNDADADRRMDTLAKAEKLLMDELPIAPTFYRYRNAVVKPRVKGVVVRAKSPDVDFRFADIVK